MWGSVLVGMTGWGAVALVQGETVRARIVDHGHDYLRDGDGRPNHQFHVHRWGLVKDEATGLSNIGNRVELDLTVDVDGDGQTDDDVVAYHEFSLTRPFSPDAPWYDSLAGSPRFHGGAALYQADRRDTGFSEDGVNHEHDGPLYLPRDNWALFHESYEINSPDRLGAVWIWKKEDFLNGGDRHRVSFDSQSALALYLQRYFMGVDGVRFVIQDGEQFYLSEQVFQGAGQQRGTGDGKQHILCPANTRWAKYHPQAPHDIWFDVTKARFEKHDFQDVRGVGVYVFKDRFMPSYFGYKWYAFEVDAVVHRPPDPPLPATPVSSDLWKRVFRLARSNTFVRDPRGYIFDRGGDMGSIDYWGAPRSHSPDKPVTDITYYDAAVWCNALSEIEGRLPVDHEDEACAKVYKTAFIYRPLMQLFFETDRDQAAGLLPKDRMLAVGKIHAQADADGCRLPTVEEHAAAGGANRAPHAALARGWLFDNADGTTHPVGQKPPSEFGLYDMQGNVSELCAGDSPAWDVVSGVGVVFIASESDVMYAVDAKTGTVKWQTTLGQDKPCGTPAVVSGVVFIGAGASGGSEVATMTGRPVMGLDAQTGQKVWEAASGPQGYAAICVDGQTVLAGNNGPRFCGLRPRHRQAAVVKDSRPSGPAVWLDGQGRRRGVFRRRDGLQRQRPRRRDRQTIVDDVHVAGPGAHQ